MTKRTTDEWQTLLDGTTPGPWGHYVPRGADGHYDPVFGDVPGDEISLVKRPADWHLIAAAPEAVAEVVRLRRALEELLDTLSKAKLDIARGDYEYGQHTGFLLASSRITRILEGQNDE